MVDNRAARRRNRRPVFLALDAAVPAVLIVGAILAVWYLTIWIFAFKPFILPAPEAALRAIARRPGTFAANTLYTAFEAVSGFILSIVIGGLCATAIVWSRTWDRALMPIIVASQTFPKAAVAPLLVIWFGFGLSTKVIVAFMIAYFPIVISLVVGMRSADASLVDLVRAMRSTKFELFWKVRIPNALPHFFAGLKTSAAFALTGAVVGEWVGADRGLGYMLITANANLDTETVFAILLILMTLGFAWIKSIDLLERFFIPWHVSIRKDSVVTM